MRTRKIIASALALAAPLVLSLTTTQAHASAVPGSTVTAATASAPVHHAAGSRPGTAPLSLSTDTVFVWATNVHVRLSPTTNSGILTTVSTITVFAVCQEQGQTVTDPAVGTNNWWTAVNVPNEAQGGWINNLYLQGGVKIAGVPDCFTG